MMVVLMVNVLQLKVEAGQGIVIGEMRRSEKRYRLRLIEKNAIDRV